MKGVNVFIQQSLLLSVLVPVLENQHGCFGRVLREELVLKLLLKCCPACKPRDSFIASESLQCIGGCFLRLHIEENSCNFQIVRDNVVSAELNIGEA